MLLMFYFGFKVPSWSSWNELNCDGGNEIPNKLHFLIKRIKEHGKENYENENSASA